MNNNEISIADFKKIRRKKSNQTNATTLAIIGYLNTSKCWAWRNNTIGVFDPVKKVFRRNKHSLRGAADIIGLTQKGQFLSVELKTGKDKMSIHQEYFREQITNHGGIYLCVKDFDDFLKQFSQHSCNKNPF